MISLILFILGSIGLIVSAICIFQIFKTYRIKTKNEILYSVGIFLAVGVTSILLLRFGNDIHTHDCTWKEIEKQEATCTETGWVTYKCSYFDCGEKKTERLDRKEHLCENWKQVFRESCAKKGLKTGTCKHCGEKMTEEIPATGNHQWQKTETFSAEMDLNIIARHERCTVCQATIQPRERIERDEMVRLFKKECKSYRYKDIARNPERYEGKMAVTTGEVFQIDGSAMLVMDKDLNITYVEYNYSTLRLLEGDWVTLYGYLNGEKTYTTIYSNTKTVPLFEVSYAEMK